MTALALPIAQTAAILFLAAWMFTGVKDNWLHPDMNRAIVAVILRIERLEQLYPDDFAQVRHRRVESAFWHRAIFRLIVIWESLTVILCSIAAGAMVWALVGDGSLEFARALALLGATAFTATWAGFLSFGNHWVYWYCHEWGQNSHFQLLLWGLATMILLAVGQAPATV